MDTSDNMSSGFDDSMSDKSVNSQTHRYFQNISFSRNYGNMIKYGNIPDISKIEGDSSVEINPCIPSVEINSCIPIQETSSQSVSRDRINVIQQYDYDKLRLRREQFPRYDHLNNTHIASFNFNFKDEMETTTDKSNKLSSAEDRLRKGFC